MDEYYETKKKIEQKKNELKDLSNKFRELKNLVYDYRDKKEDEVKELNKRHDNLKLEIENNQKNYEKLIDQTADEISNFIEKANLKESAKPPGSSSRKSQNCKSTRKSSLYMTPAEACTRLGSAFERLGMGESTTSWASCFVIVCSLNLSNSLTSFI